MRSRTLVLLGSLFVAAPFLVLACKKEDDSQKAQSPSAYPSGSAYGAYGQQPPPGYGGYPQQQGGAYPQQGGYPQQQPSGYPPAQSPGATQPPTSGSAAPGQMAVPGPAALPCSNDSMCMTHRCNLQYGKCAFPCESDNDCIQGAYCFKSAISTCLPKPPGQQ